MELYIITNDIDPDFFALTKKPFQFVWDKYRNTDPMVKAKI